MAKKHKLTIEEKLQQALVPKEEQPYEIPDNWCWVRLNSVADIFTGNSINAKEKTSKYTNLLEGYNYIATKDVGFNSDINYDNGIKIPFDTKLRVAKKGSTLLCIEGGSAGKKYGFLKEDVCFVNKLCAFYPRFFNPKYLFYFLQSPCFSIEFKQQMNGLIGGVSLNKLKNMVMVLTPLEEQQKLVNKIDFLFAKLDKAKDFIQATIDKFEQNKVAVLHKAFTGELTATWRKEHNLDLSSWKKYPLQEVCTKITDGTHHSPVNTETGDFMYITAKNIKENKIDLSNITYVSADIHEKIYARCNVEFGDVLYIKDGATTGIATINTIREPFSLLSSVAVIKPKKNKLLSKYLVYNLNSPEIKNAMINNMAGVAITRLTLTKIKKAEFNLPTIEEQQQIVAILDKLFAKYNKLQSLKEQLVQIELLKKSILAKAFRGGLGTNDGDEESAMELLKSILANED